MTNSLRHPTEVFEITYPVRVQRYGLRAADRVEKGSIVAATGSFAKWGCWWTRRWGCSSERRVIAPYGLAGGGSGAKGKNELISRGRRKRLASKCGFYAKAGDIYRIESPGGGGWGKE